MSIGQQKPGSQRIRIKKADSGITACWRSTNYVNQCLIGLCTIVCKVFNIAYALTRGSGYMYYTVHLGRCENGERLFLTRREAEKSHLSLRLKLDNTTSASLGHSTLDTIAINQGGGLFTASSQPAGPDTLRCIQAEARLDRVH